MLFFFKQQTAYDIETGDLSSDVCSSVLTMDCVTSKRRYFKYLRISIFLSLAPISILPTTALAQTAADNAQVEYVFKKGDTLIALASKYLRKKIGGESCRERVE